MRSDKYGKAIANFILNDLKGILNKRKLTIEQCPLATEVVGFLVRQTVNGNLNKQKLKPLVIKLIEEKLNEKSSITTSTTN